MGYRKMRKQVLYQIYRRWQAGQALTRIAANERWDRKTVRDYLEVLERAGLSQSQPLLPRQEFYLRVDPLLPKRQSRSAPASEELARYEEEIRSLVEDPEEPLKPKSAYLVIRAKYKLPASYETFKRFVREKGIGRKPKKTAYRIEVPPGLESQLDYGKVGKLYDPNAGANRVVWAFCGVLSHSRLPYFEWVYCQKQEEFAGSTVSMIHTYGGATETVRIDNLKAGVIKPDLWDPQINRCFAEVAEYYGFFVDPCRVGRSTDKGKVERLVPIARELFRMLKKMHPTADLAELNRLALKWCWEDYGRREHGTTGIAPVEAFVTERPLLKPLPEERFVVPIWKQVHVHWGDQFFSFDGKLFAMPKPYRAQNLWVRYVSPLLQVFSERQLVVREYVVSPGKRRYWQPEDFPEGVREMMNGDYPSYLVKKADLYGPEAARFIASVLQPHAYLNARRARGMLDLMQSYHRESFFTEVCLRARSRSVKLPSTFKRMLEFEHARAAAEGQLELPLSDVGRRMVRDVGYYVGNN